MQDMRWNNMMETWTTDQALLIGICLGMLSMFFVGVIPSLWSIKRYKARLGKSAVSAGPRIWTDSEKLKIYEGIAKDFLSKRKKDFFRRSQPIWVTLMCSSLSHYPGLSLSMVMRADVLARGEGVNYPTTFAKELLKQEKRKRKQEEQADGS